MATYREVAYMISDELKIVSDDSLITKEHIMFLMDKYRSYLLKKYYSDVKKSIPESNYQTIDLSLEVVNGIEGDCCTNQYLRSTIAIPNLIGIAIPRVSSLDFLGGEITYVSRERMKFVGLNKYLKNIIYCTIGPDDKLYMKSSNPQAYYLDRVELSGVFENSSAIAEYPCISLGDTTVCEVLDTRFPLEEALIPIVVESIVKELSGSIYRPSDEVNNAKDDLANKISTSNKRVK